MHHFKKSFTGSSLLYRRILTLAVFGIVLVATSCKLFNKKEPLTALTSTTGLRFAPVTYPVHDIRMVLDSANSDHFVFQYISPTGDYQDPFTLVSYARDSTDAFIDTIGFNLNRADSSFATFSGQFLLGNLKIFRSTFDSLLTTATGQMINDGFILFTPQFDSGNGYIFYSLEVKNSTISKDSTLISKAAVRPCPPAPNCLKKPGP